MQHQDVAQQQFQARSQPRLAIFLLQLHAVGLSSVLQLYRRFDMTYGSIPENPGLAARLPVFEFGK